MTLTEQEVALALKGHPVKTLAGKRVVNIAKIDHKTLVFKLEGSTGVFEEDIEDPCHELCLDYHEARRIGFIPRPEFRDEIEVKEVSGTVWNRTVFLKWSVFADTLICVDHNDIGYYREGKSFNTKGYTEWRWPVDSPYNTVGYRFGLVLSK